MSVTLISCVLMHWAIFMYDLKSESFVRESGYHSTEAECEEERHNLFFPYRFYCLPVPTGKWPAVPIEEDPPTAPECPQETPVVR